MWFREAWHASGPASSRMQLWYCTVVCTCAPVAERVVSPLQGGLRRCTTAAINDAAVWVAGVPPERATPAAAPTACPSTTLAQSPQGGASGASPCALTSAAGFGSTILPGLQAAPVCRLFSFMFACQIGQHVYGMHWRRSFMSCSGPGVQEGACRLLSDVCGSAHSRCVQHRSRQCLGIHLVVTYAWCSAESSATSQSAFVARSWRAYKGALLRGAYGGGGV